MPPDGAKAEDAIAGDHPFIMQADGRAWLYVAQGLEDGPLPTHYEPQESPFENPLYSQRANPRRQQNKDLAEDPYNPVAGEPGSEVYPYVVTTYRLTEHHTAGGMTPHGSASRRAAAGDVLRGASRARAGGRARARRLGDDLHVALRDRGARPRHRADAAAADAGRPHRPPGRAAVPLGAARARDRRLGERPRPHGARPERPHPGGQGVHLRDPARPPAARRPSCRASWRGCAKRRARSEAKSERARRASRDVRRRAARRSASASSPTRRSASAARRARSRARSGTSSRQTATTGRASRTTTPRRSARTPGGTSRSSSTEPCDGDGGSGCAG